MSASLAAMPNHTATQGRGWSLTDVGSSLRRTASVSEILDVVTATVNRIVPTANVWAVHRSCHGDVSESTSHAHRGTTYSAGRRDVDAALARCLELADGGLAPVAVPLGELFPKGQVLPGETALIWAMDSGTGQGALVAVLPGRDVDTDEQAAIRVLLDQATLALDLLSARTAAARTEALYETLTSLSTSFADSQRILDVIVRSAANLLKADAAYIMLYHEDRNLLAIHTAFGITTQAFLDGTYPPDQLLPGAAIRKRRAVGVRDLLEHEQTRLARVEGLRATLCSPLFSESRLLGVLLVSHRIVRDASKDDLRTMNALGRAAAICLANARAYAQTTEAREQLEDANRLLQEGSEAIERAVTFQQRLTELVLSGASLSDVGAVITERLEWFLHVLDPEGHTLYMTNPGQGGLSADDADRLYAHVVDQDNSFDSPALTPFVVPGHDSTDLSGLATVLRVGGTTVAVVVLATTGAPPSRTDVSLAEAAVTALGLSLMRDRAAVEAEARLTGGLIDLLLSNTDIDESDVSRRASYLGYDFSGLNVVIAVRTPSDAPHAGMTGQLSTHECIRRAIRRHDPQAVVFERRGSIYVVLSDPAEVPSEHVRDQADRIQVELSASGRRSNTLIASGGHHRGIEGFRRSFLEANHTLDVIATIGASGPASFDRLGIWTLLGRVQDRDHLRAFADDVLGELAAHDEEHSSDFLPTLRQLVTRNYHYRTAADDLYVHPNTLRYRMGRITEVTGLDLDDADSRLNVELALRIVDVLTRAEDLESV